jgi:hypothetical protein
MVSNVTRSLWSRQFTSIVGIYANSFSPDRLRDFSGQRRLHIDILEIASPDSGIAWASLFDFWFVRNLVVMVTGLSVARAGGLDVRHLEVLGKTFEVTVSLFGFI